MIFGHPGRERICLNEATLWSGYPRRETLTPSREERKEGLAQARLAVEREDYAEAERLLEGRLLGEFTESYLPLGVLSIESPDLEMKPGAGKRFHYERGLDLETGTAWVEIEADGGQVRREYFCSYPDQCMVIRMEAGKPLSEVRLSLESELKCLKRETIEGGPQTPPGIAWELQCPEHVDPVYVEREGAIRWGDRGKKFWTCVRVLETDGQTETDLRTGLKIRDARGITLVVTVIENPVFSDGYKILRKRHVEDYQELYGRMELFLGEQPDIPTDERLKAFREGKEDVPLYALYFQYGRYLLMSSSRGRDSLPATLQGIWCWEMRPPWSSNWTTNINTQMNYWPAHKCGLSECVEPYLEWMKHLAETGAETARNYFGCGGWCVNHNVDGWYASRPVGRPSGETLAHTGSSEYAWFPLGGVWLCEEVWRTYEYHPDGHFLRETVLPLLAGAVRFCLDWLTPFGEYYVTNPSTSPEHRFEDPKAPGRYHAVSLASTMDMSLVKELFQNFRKAAEEERRTDLENDAKKKGRKVQGQQIGRETLQALLAEIDRVEPSLYPFRIGAVGRLQEWYRDFREKEEGHRHLSHLCGLFPGELFEGDKRLTEAARKSLDYRMEHGSGQTGWSCAWAAELYAALGDGEKAGACLARLLAESTYDNLWDAHPPLFFQIDGNLGGTSAIADMLAQDRGGQVRLLPALPRSWKEGRVRGLQLKGNKTLELAWKDGKVTKYRISESCPTLS